MNVEKPKTIYLQIENASESVKQVGDYTWSQNRIFKSDLKYVLVERSKAKEVKRNDCADRKNRSMD